MKLKIRHVAEGNSRRLNCLPDLLYAEECVSLHGRLLIMNLIRGFDAHNLENIVRIRGVRV